MRTHPQSSFGQTVIERSGLYGRLRSIYSRAVLCTQLNQLKRQGSYDAFRGEWHPFYEVRRLKGARARPDGIPPSLFWESDVAKWLEATCYFLASPADEDVQHDRFLRDHVDELVNQIEAFQRADGYIGIYFTVVDPDGRLKNFRDMHELYNAGHMLEAALAHHQITQTRQLLDVMIRNVDFWIEHLGRGKGQLRAYCGHPEMELAILRLYALTKDPRHFEFGQYLLSERGYSGPDTNGKSFFRYEADDLRKDIIYHHQMFDLDHLSYVQAHKPLHDQKDILGHSVRALYLLTAAADCGGPFLADAIRLWKDCVDHKMYATGGIGTERQFEGFHEYPYRLPQSTAEGGGYAETCASIAGLMVSERLLSHKLDGRLRDIMELVFLNGVIGGGSLDGHSFNYHNDQATSGEETAIRAEWFEVCCCPPNLSRTLGMLGGYTWNVKTTHKHIQVDIYLFVSATRSITLPDGTSAKVTMRSEMPWAGDTNIFVEAPEGYNWTIQVPIPAYATGFRVSSAYDVEIGGFAAVPVCANTGFAVNFDLPVRFLASHPLSNTETLVVSRGPIVYTAESVDNEALEADYPHFAGIGFSEFTRFDTRTTEVAGFDVVNLEAKIGDVYGLSDIQCNEAWREVTPEAPFRTWNRLQEKLVLTPWFARANKGGKGRIRTAFRRVLPSPSEKG